MTISGNIADVINQEFYPGTIYVRNGKIAEIKREPGKIYPLYIVPGLVDSHVHIESSMVVPTEFARAASVHGTVAAVSDPHEIANVLGMKGVEFMLENARNTPFKFAFGAPSCVPATTFETSGQTLGQVETDELLSRKDIKYLSEMMNFPGVLYDDPNVWKKIELAKKYNKPIDGHAPGLDDAAIKKYAQAGISTDHETFTLEEARRKISAGMKIMIREGSAAKNFEALVPLLKESPEFVMFCSDDKHPDDLLSGHINLLIKRALELGYDFFSVIRAATLNPVRHFSLEAGLLQKGDNADFIIIDSPKNFNVIETIINGQVAAEKGNSYLPTIIPAVVNNFQISEKKVEEFQIEAKSDIIKVIGAIDGELITEKLLFPVKVDGNNIISDVKSDVLKIAVINRYNESKPSIGFIHGFGIKSGAIAASVGHDSHNIIAVGVSDKDICRAVNLIISEKGGLTAVYGDREHILPLPIAGIISDKDLKTVAKSYSEIDKKVKAMGCKLKSPFMTLSFMALPVIPKLKITDKGLFDVDKFAFTDIFK
ncbi:MAG: adenine deaminase [Candidatus Riflebacteria bacterium]|nr:adenine deaminase [Candidatus Riflebacteria bacterium]